MAFRNRGSPRATDGCRSRAGFPVQECIPKTRCLSRLPESESNGQDSSRAAAPRHRSRSFDFKEVHDRSTLSGREALMKDARLVLGIVRNIRKIDRLLIAQVQPLFE